MNSFNCLVEKSFCNTIVEAFTSKLNTLDLSQLSYMFSLLAVHKSHSFLELKVYSGPQKFSLLYWLRKCNILRKLILKMGIFPFSLWFHVTTFLCCYPPFSFISHQSCAKFIYYSFFWLGNAQSISNHWYHSMYWPQISVWMSVNLSRCFLF